MQLFIRIFANCEDDSTAQRIEGNLLQELSRFDPVARAAPRRYWKIQELYEFTFDLSPATRECFVSITDKTSGGWSHNEGSEEFSSVWNRVQDHAFLIPEVRWANLELHETPATG
jgi:hypothetical protein